MTLPKSVLVGHRKIDIVPMGPNEALGSGAHGMYHSCTSRIQINTEVNPDHLREVLLHEILHAVYDIYGISDDDDEERIVSLYAPALIRLFMDNPKVLKAIHGYPHNDR